MTTPNREERIRRRLTPATMPPEQRAAYERRRAERETPEYQAELAADVAAYQREYPPAEADPGLRATLETLRAAREAQNLSLTDVMERTRIDRATISKLETGKIPNPTYKTIRDYAAALGKRVVWSIEDAQ
jgi:hypothetical protein